jgi:hypothetical protein
VLAVLSKRRSIEIAMKNVIQRRKTAEINSKNISEMSMPSIRLSIQ